MHTVVSPMLSAGPWSRIAPYSGMGFTGSAGLALAGPVFLVHSIRPRIVAWSTRFKHTCSACHAQASSAMRRASSRALRSVCLRGAVPFSGRCCMAANVRGIPGAGHANDRL